MPNKRHPDSVIDSFLDDLGGLRDLWVRTHDALLEAPGASDAARQRLAKESCVDAFLRAAVAFEGFRSEWHITSIHKKSRQFRARLEQRIGAKLAGDDELRHARPYVSVRWPAHFSLDEARKLVDPLGRNVTLKADGKRDWSTRANDDLEAPYRTRVIDLPSADWKLITAVDALRNHLAHRSRNSLDQMNAALTALDGHRDGSLRITGAYTLRSDGIARYLWAYAEGNDGPCRLAVYYDRLEDVADALRAT